MDIFTTCANYARFMILIVYFLSYLYPPPDPIIYLAKGAPKAVHLQGPKIRCNC